MGSHHQLTPTISHSAFCCMLRSGRSGESGTLALWGLSLPCRSYQRAEWAHRALLPIGPKKGHCLRVFLSGCSFCFPKGHGHDCPSDHRFLKSKAVKVSVFRLLCSDLPWTFPTTKKYNNCLFKKEREKGTCWVQNLISLLPKALHVFLNIKSSIYWF